MNGPMTGGCHCGRVRYTAVIESDDAYLCHCRMCQRATGGIAAAFVSLPKAAVAWEREPDWYASSPIGRRPFCSSCGSPLGFAYPDSALMDLTVGSFDDPSRFKPTTHFGAECLLEAWLDTRDLERLRTDAYQPIVERWQKAGHDVPD